MNEFTNFMKVSSILERMICPHCKQVVLKEDFAIPHLFFMHLTKKQQEKIMRDSLNRIKTGEKL